MQKRILIYVPGFPGEYIPRILGEKRVIDLVIELAQRNNLDLEIVSYPGIMDNLDFNFELTRTHTYQVISEKIKLGYSVTLIGQSWGGLISLLATSLFVIDKLILITPFIVQHDIHEITSILDLYSQEFPKLITKKNIPTNVQAVVNIFKSLDILKNEFTSPRSMSIFASVNDEIIPINSLRLFFAELKSSPLHLSVIETHNDHNLTNGMNDLNTWLIQHV